MAAEYNQTIPPKDPLQILKAVTDRFVRQGFADGMRRSATLVAIAVGKLDGEARTKMQAALDQLEDEIHAAELAAQA
jgi:hypothetical protein